MSIMPHNPFDWLFPKRSAKVEHAVSPQSISNTKENAPPCCSNIIHIAYRGVSDDRLYLSYDRKWQELKYFRPKGLRAFCKECRRRVY